MKKYRRLLSLLALLLSFTLLAAACGSDDEASDSSDDDTSTDDDTSSDTADDDMADDSSDDADDDMADDSEGSAGGGTLIWAHEQEPPDLHLSDPNNNLTITAWLLQPMLEDLYAVNAANAYEPELLASEASITVGNDDSATATYTLREGLTWSDGTAFTASDVEFTFNTIMEADGEDDDGNPKFLLSFTDRTGYDTITDFTITSDTEFSVTWSGFYAGWKGLFGNVLPAHALPGGAAEAEDALRDWTNAAGDTLPSTGPLVFGDWDRGVALNFTANAHYHGSVSSDVSGPGSLQVDAVRVLFVTDTDAQINALKAGEAHLITAQPQLAFGDEIVANDQFTVATSPGPIFEHWGMNLLNVHLSDPLVREAMAYWFDKGQVMEGLYTGLFGEALPAEGLGNTYWMTNQPAYENHQAKYNGPLIDDAKANLQAAGYSESSDGIFEHPTRGRLTLRVGTTGGNALRELQQQILQAQGAAGGFEIVIDNVPGSDYFGEKPFSEAALAASASKGADGDSTVWDITQFAWVGGPWPGGQTGAYRSTSSSMPYGFVNTDFDARSDECDSTADDTARDACYNELDRYVTTLEIDAEQGLFMLPITQKPTFYAYDNQALSSAGASPDVNNGGPLANVVDFALG